MQYGTQQRQAPSAANDYLDCFTYDLVGNRLRHQRTATAGVTDTRYSYNAMDQLLTQSVGAAATGFGYDAFGRMTSRTPSGGPALSYSYTADDRLAAVAQGGSTLVSYTYDPDGFRVTQTVPGASTQDRKYLVDPVNPTGYAQVVAELREISGSNVLQRGYLIGHRVLAQISGGGTAHHLLADGRGSTRGLATESATIAEAYDYDAYGNTLDTGTMAGAAGTSLLYNGEWHDANANMQYLRARWYDSGVGRFNRIDPFAGVLGNPLTLHKYGYAHGDPVNGSDPSGLLTLAETTTITGIISSLISIGVDVSFNVAGSGNKSVGQIAINALINGLLGAVSGPLLGALVRSRYVLSALPRHAAGLLLSTIGQVISLGFARAFLATLAGWGSARLAGKRLTSSQLSLLFVANVLASGLLTGIAARGPSPLVQRLHEQLRGRYEAFWKAVLDAIRAGEPMRYQAVTSRVVAADSLLLALTARIDDPAVGIILSAFEAFAGSVFTNTVD